MSQKHRFKIYPSLLNSFSMYVNEVGYEKEGESFPFVTFEDLIGRINRVDKEIGDAAKKGIDFEDVVCEREAKYGFDGEFRVEVVEKVRGLLPALCLEQVYCELELDDTLIYGKADLVGEGRVIDLKTTSSYQFPKYLCDHQNFYLLALKDMGITRQDYIITNFSEVFMETYYLHDIKMDVQYNELDMFKRFLVQHKDLITDKKIFADE